MSKPDRDTQTLFEKLIPAYTEQSELLQHILAEHRSRRGVNLTGATPISVVNGASLNLTRSAGQLAGYAFRETSGAAPAVIRLRDGRDANAELLVPIALAAGQSDRMWFLPNGIGVTHGVFIEVVTGTIEGTVFFGPVPN